MAKTAHDVMQTQVLTVSPDDPLHAVQRLFYEEGIHGAPVVDDEGRVQGVITSTDILRAATQARDVEPTEPAHYREDLDFSHGFWGRAPEDFKETLSDLVVSEFMTTGAVSVAPDTPIPQVAHTICENKIHRVLVVDGESLCGIVSTLDLVALLA